MNINTRVGATLRVALRISGTSTPGRNTAATCGRPSDNMFVDAVVCSVNTHAMFVDAAVCGVNSDDVGSVPRPEKALPYRYGTPLKLKINI